MDIDELYILARRVLLDALDALGPHRGAVVLVGAQAVYLRVGEADLAIAPFTTDGDLAIDPSVLGEIPPLERALAGAGFQPRSRDSIGMWVTRRSTSQRVDVDVTVDLLVPAAVSPGAGRRSVRLAGHDPRAARIVRGLDGAMVDHDIMQLTALDSSDARALDLRVAGAAALLVAKLHKIEDRRGSDRTSDKDALDVLRLLRGTETPELAARFERLVRDPRSSTAAQRGRELLAAQFGARGGIGLAMAVRSAGDLADPDEIAASCLALATDLLAALG